MKILHTSDWHLGRSLYEKKRHQEFSEFLKWLLWFLSEEKIDILLVAGDIFDTTTPNNQVQEMYYRFLADVAGSGCRHVVIIGGNHDSPSFLNAPRDILKTLNVHVVGDFSGNPEDEVIMLYNATGVPEAVVCAVPYLRDRDLRIAEAGENSEDKSRKITEAITAHYAATAGIAAEKIRDSGPVPVIGMGHLFTSGGLTVEGDGVRELYIGNLAYVEESTFPASFDYLALGHLHIAQKVGSLECKRYSGSPVPMGFAEAHQPKRVIVAEFHGVKPVITEHYVPCFQQLEKISGTKEEILHRISDLYGQGSRAWLEVELTEQIPAADLIQVLEESLAGSGMEICRIKNRLLADKALKQESAGETLDNLNEAEVFVRLLDEQQITDPDQREELIMTFKEILVSMQEADTNV